MFFVFGLWDFVHAEENVGLDTKFGEQIVQIPKRENLVTINLEATIFKPIGKGPFPLVIISRP